jgi:hypothetical protein
MPQLMPQPNSVLHDRLKVSREGDDVNDGRLFQVVYSTGEHESSSGGLFKHKRAS